MGTEALEHGQPFHEAQTCVQLVPALFESWQLKLAQELMVV